ncbi:MAG: site-specific integrase [Victivallaceae bacterium]
MRAEEIAKDRIYSVMDELTEHGGRSLCWAALIATLFALGARITEATSLRRGDFLRVDGTLRDKVRRVKLKARKYKSQPIELSPKLTAKIIEEIRRMPGMADVPAGAVAIHAKTPKLEEERIERTIPDRLRPYIERWLEYQRFQYGRMRDDDFVFSLLGDNRTIHRGTAWREFKRLFPGIDNVGTHSFRRSYSLQQFRALQAERGMAPMDAARVIQRLLDHKALETTWAYLTATNANPEITISALE